MMEREVEQSAPAQQAARYMYKPAGFWVRFWAFLLDLLVVSSLGALLAQPALRLAGQPLSDTGWFSPVHIALAAVFYLYFVVMTKFFSQTLGKMALGIRVAKVDGTPLDWGTVAFREWLGRFVNQFFWGFPYLLAAFTPGKKQMADYAAGTMVVHEAVFARLPSSVSSGDANRLPGGSAV